MNILAPNQANVDFNAKNTLNWQGTLPLTGEYRIEIVSLPGAAPSNYQLEVTTMMPSPAVTSVAAPTAPTVPTAAPPVTPNR